MWLHICMKGGFVWLGKSYFLIKLLKKHKFCAILNSILCEGGTE